MSWVVFLIQNNKQTFQQMVKMERFSFSDTKSAQKVSKVRGQHIYMYYINSMVII